MRAGLAKYPISMAMCNQNLLAAMRAGVILVTGTDSGNPAILHGPAVHRELQLWVEAGIPTAGWRQGGAVKGAPPLRAAKIIGVIYKGCYPRLPLGGGENLQEFFATSD